MFGRGCVSDGVSESEVLGIPMCGVFGLNFTLYYLFYYVNYRKGNYCLIFMLHFKYARKHKINKNIFKHIIKIYIISNKNVGI